MKRIIFSLSLFYATALLAHGFSANTLVHLADGSRVAIEQLCYRIEHRRVHVASSNPRSNKIERKRAQLSGSSTSNCYLRLSFCDSCNNGDFVCTPSQPFYLHGKRRWIQAGDLQVGDALRAKSGKAQTVTDIQFVPESIDVYTLCIKKNHTFFVGTHGILTHNMLLPALPFCLKLSCAIGSGAAAGCACVPMIGPVAIGVGVSAVVLASCIMSVLSRRHVSYRAPGYDLDLYSVKFDRHADNTSWNISPSLFIEPHEPIRQGGCGVTPPELQERMLHTGGCGNAEVPTTKPVIGCGGVPPHLEHRPNSGGCGYIEVPKIEDLVLSYPILAPELSLVLAQDVATVGEKGGAKAKPKVQEHPHGVYEENKGKHHKNSKGGISPAPANGQKALDISIPVPGDTTRRVAVCDGEIVVLDETKPGVYHGHVRTWKEIMSGGNDKTEAIRKALQKTKLLKSNGKIIKNA